MASRTLNDTATISWDEPALSASGAGPLRANLIPTGAKTALGYPIVTVDNTIPRYDGLVGNQQTTGLLIDDSNNIAPVTNDAGALGTTALKWSDIFLASGAIVDWNSGDVTITHSANALAFAGATNGYSFADGPLKPAANDGVALGVSGTAFADLFLASGGVIDWAAADVTITHGANVLTFAGATTNGYQFQDGPIRPVVNDGVALGISGTAFSDAFFASGAVINFNAGDVTITHSANALAFAGATNGYSFDANVLLSTGAALNWNAGDVTVTHGADTLTVAGGGIVLAAGTATITPLKLQSGTNLTAAAAGAIEYDGKAFYATSVASNRAVNTIEHFLSLSANQTGADVATAQPWFPGGGATGLTVTANTSFFFEGLLATSKAAGVVARTVGIGFAGTATLTSIGYHVSGKKQDVAAWTTAIDNDSEMFIETAANTAVILSSATAAQVFMVYVNGIVRINAAGTFIPQFTYSAAPGGVPTIRANTWFKMRPIGSDAVLNVGDWV